MTHLPKEKKKIIEGSNSMQALPAQEDSSVGRAPLLQLGGNSSPEHELNLHPRLKGPLKSRKEQFQK